MSVVAQPLTWDDIKQVLDNAISIINTPAESAYTTTSVRKSGFISVERSASIVIATSDTMSAMMPSRIRRGLSRSGRRSGGLGNGGTGRVGTF